MKSLTRKMTMLIVIHLTVGGLATAQDADQEKTLTISGSASLPGVVMKGLLGNPVTDASGYYTVTVPSGWSGTVEPTKEGYSFSPATKSYMKIEQDRMGENYTAELIEFLISGSVGLPGVMMKGLPGDPLTGADGTYSVTVDYGWRGEVTPMKEGYNFVPNRKGYLTLVRDRTSENYTARRLSIRISGSVATEGVVMKGLPGLPIADKDGKYRASVDYGWSGTVTPTKAGYVFEPPSLSYSRVIDDQQNQDYWPTQISPAAMFGRSGGRRYLVIPRDDVKWEDLRAVRQDMEVMSHILDKQFKQTHPTQGLFTDFGPFFGSYNRMTEATYLEGYGILFTKEVNFAFTLPTGSGKQGAEKATSPVDSTWQQAQKEVFQPEASQRAGMSDPLQELDRRMVEEVKKELIETLKHTANIRVVQPDEWIILMIIADGQGFGTFHRGRFMNQMGGMMGSGMGVYGGGSSSAGGGGYGGGMAMGGMGAMEGGMGGGMRMGSGMGGMMGGMGMGGFAGMGARVTTYLTIRAKKSDIDAFAKGELDFEKFQEKVKTVIY